MVRRTQTEALKTRTSIIDAAEKLFVRDGFVGASLSAIVAEAGITKGALFHYFPNKEAVFKEVWSRLQERMTAEATQAAYDARDVDDPYAPFLAGSKVYLEWACRPDYQKILIVEGPAVLGFKGLYEAEYESGARNVRRGLTHLSNCGIIAEERIEPYGMLLLNAINGAGFAFLNDSGDVSVSELYDAFERLLRGLR
ncbi:MAG: TetR/AcrR family transcriptional regulator [Hyphomonas sp.]